MDNEALMVEVTRALAILYTDPDPAHKKTAEKWLSAVQEQPQALDLAWGLLQDGCPETVQFFGANTLQRKVCPVAHVLTKDIAQLARAS